MTEKEFIEAVQTYKMLTEEEVLEVLKRNKMTAEELYTNEAIKVYHSRTECLEDQLERSDIDSYWWKSKDIVDRNKFFEWFLSGSDVIELKSGTIIWWDI